MQLHTWELIIDGKPVTVLAEADENIMTSCDVRGDNIFTAYGQEDFLLSILFEGYTKTGDIERLCVEKYDDEFCISWDGEDYFGDEEDYVRPFTLECTRHTVLNDRESE